MTLEELRKGIESDAKIENEKLKARIEELEKSSASKIALLESDLTAMCNRCHVLYGGTMCMFCHIHSEFKCKHNIYKK